MGFFEQALANKMASTGQATPPAALQIPRTTAPIPQPAQPPAQPQAQPQPVEEDMDEKEQQMIMTGYEVMKLMQSGVTDPQQLVPQLKAIDEKYSLVSLDEVFGIVSSFKKANDFLGPAMQQDESGTSRLGKWMDDNQFLVRLGMSALAASTKGSTAEYDVGGKMAKGFIATDQNAIERERIAADKSIKEADLAYRTQKEIADAKNRGKEWKQLEDGTYVYLSPEDSGKVKGKMTRKYDLLELNGQLIRVYEGDPIPKGAKKPKIEQSVPPIWNIYYEAAKKAGKSDMDIVTSFKNLVSGNAKPEEIQSYRDGVVNKLVNDYTEFKDPVVQAKIMTPGGKIEQYSKFITARDQFAGHPYITQGDLNKAETTILTQIGVPADVVSNVSVFRKQGASSSDILKAMKIAMIKSAPKKK